MQQGYVVRTEQVFNTLELLGIVVVLFMASFLQFFFQELPCPLCLLQRLGFLGVAFGFLLNLRFGLRPSHYAISLLSAIYTSFVALRQIALHVLPGTGSYGDPLFGFHLYTWSFIISMIIVVITILMMSVDRQYVSVDRYQTRNSRITRGLFAITVFLIIVNIVSVYMECGLSICPDNPEGYVELR